MMRNFTFPIQLRACLFALLELFPRLLYSLRYVVGCACAVSIGIDIRCAHCRRLVPPVRWLLVICVYSPLISHASSPPANDVHICEVLDYEDIRARDSLYVATKQALNLNVGEPRTVRMIYFLPNDRPFQQEVVDSMKVTIRQIQTFYADQMEAHGYGRRTFRFETDAQGDPVVHRVDGQHANSYYFDNQDYWNWDEIREKFDTRANNVYLTVWDNGTNVVRPGLRGVGGGGRDGGSVLVSASFHWITVAHELGHAFGLYHDFRDDAYIMSYGFDQLRALSTCSAEFLSVHPYFNPDIPDEETPGPTIELISSLGYPTGSTSVTIRLKISDPDGLHQVILFFNGIGYIGDGYEVKACHGLAGEGDAIVEFNYNGVVPSDGFTSLSDPLLHPIYVEAVDSFGNVGDTNFWLFDTSMQRNLITTLEGNLPVHSLAFSPDGATLATGRKLWDIATQTEITTPYGNIVAFSPDGKTLATEGGVWDIATRTEIIPLESNNVVLAFSPDGTAFAEAYHDGTFKDYKIKLWDIATKRSIATFGEHMRNISSVAFSSDGTTLASGSYDGTIKLWDISSKDNIATIEAKNSRYGWVYSIAFSPDGSLLASGQGNGDSTVKLWDVATRRNIATFGHIYSVTSVAFSPDGTILASGSWDETVKLWDVATRTNIATFWANTEDIWSVAFSPDGAILASGAYDGTIRLWDTSEWLRPRPTALLKVSGDNQQGTLGAELISPLVVELRNQYGSALSLQGVPVTFTITAGDGQLNGKFTVENKMTDANGRAQTTLTLGPVAGTNTVEVSGTGLKPVTFNAVGIGTPEVPITSGDYQTWHLPEGAMARLEKGKIGSNDRAIAFSPDGQYLAVASSIGVWLYDVATYRELALIPGHMTENAFVAFSPDGTLLALGTYQGSVELWDVSTSTKIATLGIYRSWDVTSVAFSPDGTLLTLGIYGGSIELWDVSTSTKIATFEGHTSNVTSVVFSPDGTTFASGSGDNTVKLWDVATRRNIATLEGHTRRVKSVAFSPDGTILASGSGDNAGYGTLKLWDIATRRNIATLGGHIGQVGSVAFSPDGTTLAAGSGGQIRLWDIATRTNVATLERGRGAVESVAFSPDGTTLATVSWDNTVNLWDIARQNVATLGGHSGRVGSVAFSPDGTTLATGVWDRVRLWDIATRTNVATLEGHHSPVLSVSFSPDGMFLASGALGGILKLWDIATRRNIATLWDTDWITSVSFSPDGTILASGSFDNTVMLTDVATQTKIATLEHTNRVNSVTFSPDGTTLAAGLGTWLDGTIVLWDVATRTKIATLEEHTNRVNSVLFSPDGTMLASGSADRTVKLWDVATRTKIATLEEHFNGVSSVSFSPDGTLLAAGLTYGMSLHLWDIATRTKIATLEGHPIGVSSVSFSSDGTILASGSEDGTVLLWDMEKLTQPQPQTLVKVSGDKQEGVPSAPLANPLIVEVKDQNGNVLEGVAVTFSVTEGEGTLSVNTATTDSSGRAQTVLTLGNILWMTLVAVTVTVADIEQPVTFVAVAVITPDFDGDGTVGFPDFLLFVDQFGFSQRDAGYEARFDLDGDGVIGIGDFLIFVNSFGKKVS